MEEKRSLSEPLKSEMPIFIFPNTPPVNPMHITQLRIKSPECIKINTGLSFMRSFQSNAVSCVLFKLEKNCQKLAIIELFYMTRNVLELMWLMCCVNVEAIQWGLSDRKQKWQANKLYPIAISVISHEKFAFG